MIPLSTLLKSGTIESGNGLFRTMFNNISDAIVVHDFTKSGMPGQFLEVNDAACRRYGYTHHAFLNLSPGDICSPEPGEVKLQNNTLLQANGHTSLETVHVTKSGERFPVEIDMNIFMFDEQKMCISLIRDITARKKTEEAIRESKKKYQDLVENINEVIFTLDQNGILTYVSPVVETLKGGFGYSAEELIGHSFTEILHPDDVRKVVAKYHATLDGHPETTEFRVVGKSGEIRWIQESGRQIIQDGAVVGLQGLFSDVTDRKQIEEALRNSELEYRTITEISDDAIFTIGSDFKIERVNSTFAAYMQMDPASMPGMLIRDVFPGTEYDIYQSLSLEVLQTNTPVVRDVLMPLPHESRWFRIRITPFSQDKTPEKLLVYATDTHDLTLLKQALEVTNRKLNMLTSVMRHDILNYLMVIRAGAEMMDIQSDDRADRSKNLEFIKKSADGIERLLILSREYQSLGVEKPQWHRVSEVIGEVMNDKLFDGIEFDVEVGTSKIYADALCYMVLFNLFENAVRHGESVTRISVRFSPENATALLTVRDNGAGIPEEEKDLIFNEKYGKHTGFGLFFVREILDITGISVAETGTAGEGAVFEMRIPEGCWRMD